MVRNCAQVVSIYVDSAHALQQCHFSNAGNQLSLKNLSTEFTHAIQQ